MAPGEIWRTLRALVGAERADRDSQEEFAFHVDMETRKNIELGMAPAEARRRAERAFGNRSSVREQTRDERGGRWVEETLRDAALGLRHLVRRPGFSLLCIVTIALGIGSVTAIWSVVDGVLLRPAPVANLERLVMLWQTDRGSETLREPASWPDFEDFRRELAGVDAVAAIAGAEGTYQPEEGDNQRVVGIGVTPGYFDLLGLPLLLGPGFDQRHAEPGGPLGVVLGERFWRTRLDGAVDVVGSRLRFDDQAYTVLGVAPEAAGFGLEQIHARAAYHSATSGGRSVDLWLPIRATAESHPRDTHPFLVLGRRAEGVPLDDLRREAEDLAAALESGYPRSNANRGLFVEPLGDVVFAPVRGTLWLLAAAVGLLVVVAFVNVTNLLLARGARRHREVAVRTALGAGIVRIARQLLVENALLTALGAALGVALGTGLLQALLRFAPADLPRVGEVALDGRVLLLTLGVAVVGACLFGLVPTLQALRVDVLEAMGGRSRGGGDHGRPRLRRLLVVAQLALSVALVVFAGLLARSLWNVVSVDPGFRADGVLKAQVQLPTTRYPRDFSAWPHWNEVLDFQQRVLERAAAVPGVEAVTLAGEHPLDAGFTNSFEIVGSEEESRAFPEIAVRRVSPSYAGTVGLRLVEGRFLEEGDGADASPVAVLNRAAAERLFEGRSPLGRSVRFWGTERRIVGVVENELIHGLTEPAPITLYASVGQIPTHSVVLLARVEGDDPLAAAPGLVAAVQEVDPALAVFGVEPLADTVAGSVAERRFAMLVLVVLAGATLLLALFGVHGVLSYSAARRTREMGIRSALGAGRRQLGGMVVRSGLGMATAGVAVGLALAAAGSRLLSGLLYGVGGLDPLTFLTVPLLVLAVSALASWLPARRAARVEVLEALRVD